MKLIKYNYQFIVLLIFFTLVFIFGLFQRADPDMYGHIAAGNVIAHNGITNTETLTHQTGPREVWIPFEWGFQLFLYVFTSWFSFSSYHIFIGMFSVVQILLFYLLVKKALSLSFSSSFLSTILYSSLVYNYLVARPQILAMSFFIAELILILFYVLRNKNLLFLLLPLIYVWANFHASVVLGILFSTGYTCISMLYFFITKDIKFMEKARMLGSYTVCMIVVSMLPPQGFMQYQILGINFQHSELIRAFTAEWQPIIQDAPTYLLYLFITITSFIGIFYFLRNKKDMNLIWVSPLVILLIYGFFSFRNTPYGYLAASIYIGLFISLFHGQKFWQKVFFIQSIFFLFLWSLLQTIHVHSLATITYPQKAVDFIQKKQLKGNMFDQYVYGGYLEYRLYPTRTVFMDGRTLPSPCCKVQDFYKLQTAYASFSDKDFQKAVEKFFSTYEISYVLLVMTSDGSGQALAHVLRSDPAWNLVFEDTISVIFVKKDGKNPVVNLYP